MLTFLVAVALAFPVQLPREWIDPYSAAARALERRELDDARRGFEAALAVLPTHGPSAYGLACTAALAGDTAAALELLELTDALDPLEAGVLTWDLDLASLRAEPRFVALVERARRRTPQLANSAAWPMAWRQGGRIESCDNEANVAVLDASAEHEWAGLRSLVDLRTNETIAVLGGPSTSLYGAAVEPRGGVVALVEQHWWRDVSHVVLFDARTGERRRDVFATDDEVELRFTLNGRLAVRQARSDDPGVVIGVVDPSMPQPLSPLEPLAPQRPSGAAHDGLRLDDPDFILHADRRETATALAVPKGRGEVWIGTHDGGVVIVDAGTGRERGRLAVSDIGAL